MSIRIAVVFVSACLCGTVSAQSPAPNLTRPQRELLQALISAVDAQSASPVITDVTWQIHVLRASDGSHYVAASVTPPQALLPFAPTAVYVRLSTVDNSATAVAERSLVRDWLQGSRVDPRMLPRSGMVIGEMPAMGAGAIGGRGAAAVGSADLQAMGLQRERARQRRDDEEKQRRAALEGAAVAATNVLPFEDFELVATPMVTDGTASIQRAITAGPGEYHLFVAWGAATQSARPPRLHVARRSITLGPAAPELALSSVIIADRIAVREVPYSAVEQRAHPYSIGATDIVPARDTVFTPDERLAAAFQIVNPAPDAAGKPDVIVNLRVARVTGAREDPLAALSPLVYNAASLPADFDARLGHPLIAALAVPLATIPRGTHRLVITVEDRNAKAVVASRAEFSVIGSASSLLAEAPPLGPRFDLHAALDTSIVVALTERLTPAAPTPALARALSASRSGRFAELLIEDRVAPNEEGIRFVLRALALLSLGDLGAINLLERAQGNADQAAIDYLLGTARALQGRDAEAIQGWNAARASGLSRIAVGPLAAAHLRRREFTHATEVLRGADTTSDPALGKLMAAAWIGQRRNPDAVAVLDTSLRQSPDDMDARWLLLHALFAEAVTAPGAPRQRFLAEAQRYIDARGSHSTLAADWTAVLSK